MSGKTKQRLIGALLLAGGLIAFLVGYSGTKDTEATCDGGTMGPNDKCVVMYSDGHTATFDPQGEVGRQQRHGVRNELVGGLAMLLGATAIVLTLDVEDAADSLRLRFGKAARGKAAKARAAQEPATQQRTDRGQAYRGQAAQRPAGMPWRDLLPALATARELDRISPAGLALQRRTDPSLNLLLLDGGLGEDTEADSAIAGVLGGFRCRAFSTRAGTGDSGSAGIVLTLPADLPRLRFVRSPGLSPHDTGALLSREHMQCDDPDFARGLLNQDTLSLLAERRIRTLAIEGPLLSGTVDGSSVHTVEAMGRAFDAVAEIARILPTTWP